MFLLSAEAYGQTQLKTNALYWLVGMTNVAVETVVGKKITFNSSVEYSPWKSIKGNRAQMFRVVPEFRFYPGGSFNGFYAGGYAAFHLFNMTKWNYINSGMYQKGYGYSFGVVAGYQFPISENWKLDIYAGGGYQHSRYRGYRPDGSMYIGWNGSGEWMLYQVGVSCGYRIGK